MPAGYKAPLCHAGLNLFHPSTRRRHNPRPKTLPELPTYVNRPKRYHRPALGFVRRDPYPQPLPNDKSDWLKSYRGRQDLFRPYTAEPTF